MGSPQPAPNSLPHCGSPGMGGYGEGKTLHACTRGDAMGGNGLHATQAPCHRLRAARGVRGVQCAPHPGAVGRGCSEPRGRGSTGQYSQLQTCCPLSSVGRRTLGEGRRNQQQWGSQQPLQPLRAPSPASLAHLNRPQLHHMLPAPLPACRRLGSFDKHQRCLQMQLKNVGIDCPTPSSFFSVSAFPLEVEGISQGPPTP